MHHYHINKEACEVYAYSIQHQKGYKIYLPVTYEMYKKDDTAIETTTITIISFLENVFEGKLTDLVC